VVHGLYLAVVNGEELALRARVLHGPPRLRQLDLLDAVGGEDGYLASP
jgi:hypothetical protein